MADAHGRSVVETNKVNVCVVVDIMRIYQCSVHLFTVTQRKENVIKHRCLFLFHTQLILLAGVRADGRDGRTATVADFFTLISKYSCCSCTQMRSMKLLFASQNSRSLNTSNFRFLKGVEIGC